MNSSGRAGLSTDLPLTEWLGEGSALRLAFSAYPAEHPWLHLLISHGFGEHRGWYDHVARSLVAVGISVYTFDHFHHGISSGKPGDVRDYGQLTAGLRMALLQGVIPRCPPGAPLALLGHSNGGLALIRALPSLPVELLAGVILCNPLLGLRPKLAFWGMLTARLLEPVAPGLMVPFRATPSRLTSDESLWNDYKKDRLRLRSLSIRFFREMAESAGETATLASCQGLPLLLLLAELDFVVDKSATMEWFRRVDSPEKELIEYPGLRHELFQEPSWQSVLADAIGWLRRRKPGAVEAPARAEG